MSISWPDLIFPVFVVAVVLAAIAIVGWFNRRKRNEYKAGQLRRAERLENAKQLREWLHEKLVYDLADSDTQTAPLIKALLQITDQSGTVDELRPIAEVYRYRKGFNNEWIGE